MRQFIYFLFLLCFGLSLVKASSACLGACERDVLFLIDTSRFVTKYILSRLTFPYIQDVFCSFQTNSTKVKLGMFSFGEEIAELLPFQPYSYIEFSHQLNELSRSTKCCRGFTPIAEAFRTAYETFRRHPTDRGRMIIVS